MDGMYEIIFLVLGVLTEASKGAVSCSADWLYNPHHDTCVKAFSQTHNWFDARDFCSTEKSTLLDVDSDEMRKFIMNDLASKGTLQSKKSFWIASNDILEENFTRSVFGRSISYSSWDPSTDQPNDAEQLPVHSQNCVIDFIDADFKQQDKDCVTHKAMFVCEKWPRDIYGGQFQRLQLDSATFENFGDAGGDDDFSPVKDSTTCALKCLSRYYFCQVYIYSSKSANCKLFRLYEEGYFRAVSNTAIKIFSGSGYEAFIMKMFEA